MKKLNILIPALVATTCMPFIGLVGCNPVNIEDYKINDEDITKIIGMEGVQYLQVNGQGSRVDTKNDDPVVTNSTHAAEFSPTVYHDVTNTVSESTIYNEKYVYEDTSEKDKYEMIERDDPEGTFSNPTTVTKLDLIKPEVYAEQILLYYAIFIAAGGTLTFDAQNLMYKGEAGDVSTSYISVEYHFFHNQLVKYKIHLVGDTINDIPELTVEETCTYNETTPIVPK